MTKPEKRWQLLLVADDGRIIPFKHIKGVALTLLVALVIMGLVCAGLGWLLTKEKTIHRQTLDRLATARQEAARYKSDNEIVTAELILANARMEKAGLPVPGREVRLPQKKAAQSQADHQPPLVQALDEHDRAMPETKTSALAEQANVPSIRPTPSVIPEPAASGNSLKKTSPSTEPPMIALSRFDMHYDSSTTILRAVFRVSNTGPRSSPVAGRCVLVLKNEQIGPEAWLALPDGAILDGKPRQAQGQPFKISRFIDMAIEAAVKTDPSVFDRAVVYVFDLDGGVLLEKAYPIHLKR